MESVYLQLSRYVQPAIIVFGTIGALLNQALFYFRKPLRSTSCTLYFRGLSANDLLVLYIVVLPLWLSNQFNIDPSKDYDWCCKIKSYLTYSLYTLSPYFIVLACFDRLCTSSTNAKLRRIATVRIASFLVPFMCILVSSYYLYVAFWSQLVSYRSYTFCAITNPTYNKLLVFSVLIFFCCMPPVLMIIFCGITVILLRKQRRRIMPINQARLRHRDNQLIKMLLIYVTSNITCITPFSITYYRQLYYYNNPSPLSDVWVQICIILVNATYATSFYMYTLGTPYYRDQLFNLVKIIWQRIYHVNNAIINLQRRGTTVDT